MVKTHPKSFFIHFGADSYMADRVLSANPRVTYSDIGISNTVNDAGNDVIAYDIVILQIEWLKTSNIFIAEIIKKSDYSTNDNTIQQ